MIKTVVCVFLVSLLRLSAQTQPTDEFHHQIGVSGSTISGLGISYQYIFSDKYRIKMTGLYLNEDYNNYERTTLASAGIEGQRSLYKSEKMRLYGFVSGSWYLKKDAEFYYPDYSSSSARNRYTGGAGLGVEMLTAGRIAFTIDIGLSYALQKYHHKSNIYYSSNDEYRRSEVGFGIGGGIGIGYQF